MQAMRSRPMRAGRLVCLVAMLGVAAIAGRASASDEAAVQAHVADNAALEARLSETRLELDDAQAALASTQERRRALETSVARIEAYGKRPELGREFVETVLQQLLAMPRSRPFLARYEADRLAIAASDAHLRTLRALGRIGQADTVPSGAPGEQTPLQAALARQHQLLLRLEPLQGELVKTLHDRREAERALERWSKDASARLLRLLYWVPVQPGWQSISELDNAAAWTLSPSNWARAAGALRDGATGAPVFAALAFLAVAGLLAARGRLRRMLAATAPDAPPPGGYRLIHAIAALALTLAIALPIPLGLYAAGTLVHPPGDADAFVASLHRTLLAAAPLLFALSALAWALDANGLAIRHFGWNATALGYASQTLRRFTAVFVPVLGVAALNGLDAAPFANRESLSRAAIIVAMLLATRLVVRLFGPRSAPMKEARANAPRSWVVRFHGLWFAALLAVPLGILALALAGYFVAASFILGRVVVSLFLVLGAAALYGFMAVWVRLLHARLESRRGAADRIAHVAAATAGAPLQRRADDVDTITERTRSLLDLAVTVLLVGGIWLVWRDLLPALAQIGDYVLWTHADTVDGKTVETPLTIGDVFLAAISLGLTFVAVRNIGALLEVVLLKRLELRDDASFAIRVTARYVTAMVGAVVTARILGIAWDDVQWLVAALSVGLGFGLQEIVANFVAGIIVLAERPVRIGDVVTVGDVSGTVARIQARVLTLVDFDNKEVLIPNKSLITDRVINWTLSSQTTRLVQKITVNAETDLALAQRVILEAVQGNPDVLAEPGPRVFFVAFGSGGALTLEINAFVGSFDRRQRVQHEINLAVDDALRRHGIRAA
jgi:potassium efflux system protein